MSGIEIPNLSIAIILFVILIIAVTSDLASHRIPNILLFPALALALMLHTVYSGTGGFLSALAGLALGIGMLLPLYAMGGMGAGDVKLLGVVGSFLGPWGTVVAGMATMVAGAFLGITLILWQRFKPTLHLKRLQWAGAHIKHPPAPGSIRAESRMTQIAYAPAIAVGTLVALWYIGIIPINGLT
jgi:prepilin peptidase CpaA